MRLKPTLASSGLLVSAALLSLLSPGASKAVLNCTFGDTSACSDPEGNLLFSNFSFAGGGAESVDNIQISKSGPGEIYTIAFNAAGGGQFDTDAQLKFTITPLDGYILGAAAASSTVNSFDNPLFSFVYTADNLTKITTSGNTVSPVSFLSPKTYSEIFLEWDNPNATASGTSLFVSLQKQGPNVPGPLPLLGAASAFGFARKLRNRTRTSA